MEQNIATLLDHAVQSRDGGQQLTALLERNPAAFQSAAARHLANGHDDQSRRLLISILQCEGRLLELLLNPRVTSVDEAVPLAGVIKQVVNQVDIHLAKALQDASDKSALRILRLMAEVCDSNRVLPLLTRILRERGPELRSRAAFIFARYCRNTLFFENALQDPEPSVRTSALDGLIAADYDPDPSILEAAAVDSNPAVRVRALVGRYRLGDEDGAVHFLATMTKDPDVGSRAAAAWALGEVGDRRSPRLLEDLRQDREESVRDAAREALEKLGVDFDAAPAGDQGVLNSNDELTLETIFAAITKAGRRRIGLAVTRADGSAIADLDERDFQITEGGKPIESLQVEQPSLRDALSLAFVLDCSKSMSISKVREVNTALVESVGEKLPPDRLAFVKYGFDIETAAEFSENPKRLKALIRRPFNGATNASRLHDALAEALEAVTGEPGCRGIVVISDGIDQGSEHTFPAIVRKLQSSGVPLYVIGYGCGEDSRELGSLARQSGGIYYAADDHWELEKVCRSLLRRLANHYELSYEREGQAPALLELGVSSFAGKGRCTVEPRVVEG